MFIFIGFIELISLSSLICYVSINVITKSWLNSDYILSGHDFHIRTNYTQLFISSSNIITEPTQTCSHNFMSN